MALPTPDEIQYYQEHADDNQQGKLWAAAICCLVLAWVFIGLRFLARSRIEAKYQSDDWIIVGAGCAFTAFPVAMFVLLSVGFGKHIIFVTNPKLMVEMVVLCEIAYAIAIPLTKISILSLYNRIFASRKLFWTSVVIAIISVLYSLALAIVCILQCIPLSTLYTNDPNGWCMNTTPPYTVTAVANVVTDVIILCLPMKFVWRLNMPWRRKIEVLTLFALGGCVCVFGIIRSVEVGTASSNDQSWKTVPGTIWSVVEPCVGIISACLPTLRPLLPFDREAHTGYTDYSRNGNAAGGAEQKKSFNARTMLGNKPTGTVWSTATGGLSTTCERDEVEEHPFARLNTDGTAASMTTEDVAVDEGSDGGRNEDKTKKASLSDIHVRKEFHQEISRAGTIV